VAVGIVLLAVTETVTAVVAPLRAPTDADWRAAAAHVKAAYQDRDLIVAAPDWADPVLRLHLGDLISPHKAGRLDHVSYGRVWEISQRGADAPEVADGKLLEERRFGNLRARLYQRPALALLYDFQDNWHNARVFRREDGRPEIPCERQPGQHQCPGIGFNFVKDRILEMGFSLRRALLTQPVANAAVVIEYPEVMLGRELAVGAGLHNVWWRKAANGTVWLRVLVGGKEIGRFETTNRSGWKVVRYDTTGFAGRTFPVRFEVTSDKPYARFFGFAAEARGS
jgi:hypothetical protein